MTAPFRKWTPEEDARLLELIAAGKTSRSIAMDLKRAKTSIDDRSLTLQKLPQRRMRGRPWKRAEDEQLLKMVEAGILAAAIAEKLRRTREAIYSRIQFHERKRRQDSK
jgi:DNA-binding CsgD family transcriptional regulator